MKNNEIIINDYDHLITELDQPSNINDKLYFDRFFKKKCIRVKNKKIICPDTEEIKETIKDLYGQLTYLKEKLKFWKHQLSDAKNYHSIIKITKFVKKDYWYHKIKEATDQEYKQNVRDCKLTSDVLMDPAYQNLKNSFLRNPDYRKKLSDTINSSIIYKNSNIGDQSKTKQEFRAKSAEFNIKKIHEHIKDIMFQIKVQEKAIELIKKYK